MPLGAWWDLLLGLNDECDAALEAKVDATNADATIETFFDFKEGSLEESGEVTASSVGSSAGVVASLFVAILLATKHFFNDGEGLCDAEGKSSFDSLLSLNEGCENEA